jgi:hypothetical protein
MSVGSAIGIIIGGIAVNALTLLCTLYCCVYKSASGERRVFSSNSASGGSSKAKTPSRISLSAWCVPSGGLDDTSKELTPLRAIGIVSSSLTDDAQNDGSTEPVVIISKSLITPDEAEHGPPPALGCTQQRKARRSSFFGFELQDANHVVRTCKHACMRTVACMLACTYCVTVHTSIYAAHVHACMHAEPQPPAAPHYDAGRQPVASCRLLQYPIGHDSRYGPSKLWNRKDPGRACAVEAPCSRVIV